MLEAARENIFSFSPKHWFSIIYQISKDKKKVGNIYINLFAGYRAKLDIESKTYDIHSGQGFSFGILNGVYLLKNDGIIIAQYESTQKTYHISFTGGSLINLEGIFTYHQRNFLVKTNSFHKQQFTLHENDHEVGNIHIERNFLSRRLIADMSSNVPIEIQFFYLWLILCSWKVLSDLNSGA